MRASWRFARGRSDEGLGYLIRSGDVKMWRRRCCSAAVGRLLLPMEASGRVRGLGGESVGKVI
jgi:hypothetical protein